jgi:hypothetical protein
MSKETEKIYLEVAIAVAKKKFTGALLGFCFFECIFLVAVGAGWLSNFLLFANMSAPWLILLLPVVILVMAIYYFFQYLHSKTKLAQFLRATYHCPNCKKILSKDNSKFCVFCGQPIKS